MITSTRIYICSALLLVVATIPLNVIIFVITFLFSVIFGFILYLDRQLPIIEKDYEVFKENRAIHFIERDAHYWNHMTDDIERKISLKTKLDFNKKFTNNHQVDGQINELLQLVFHDFIHPWHQTLSISQHFPDSLYQFIHFTISALARRIKEINVSNLLSNKLLEELIKHIRLYRLTKNKIQQSEGEFFVNTFFDHERKLEKTFSRENLCKNEDQFGNFIDQICDTLQYLLFPYNSFNNVTFRLFTKGILVRTIFLPLFDLLTEPDFINGIIINASKSHLPSTDTFMAVVLQSADVKELRAVLNAVQNEICFVRSRDDNDDEMKMKQQLGSLLFLKKIILSLLKKFEDSEESKSLADSLNEDYSESTDPLNGASITFEAVLRHSVALGYFIEHMSSINASNYINFFINVEAFKISVEQGLFEIWSFGDGASEDQCAQLKQLVLEAALNIYESYLSPIAPNRLDMVEQSHCDTLRDNLMANDSSSWMSESLFDDILNQVRDIILKHDQFFPAFKRNKHYLKLLYESECFVKEQHDDSPVSELTSKACDDLSEIDSIDSDLGEGLKNFDANHQPPTTIHHQRTTEHGKSTESGERKDEDKPDFTNGFTCDIIDTGLLTEHGKAFVAYLINVKLTSGHSWVTLRRYSDFYLLHHLMLEKCEKFHFNLSSILTLPPKTISNRTSRQFVEYRKAMLNIYLKKLETFLYERFSFLQKEIETFLRPGNYNSKQSSRLNGSRNGRFNPIKTIGNVMKNGSENLLDGFQKLSRTLSLQHDTNRGLEKRLVQSTEETVTHSNGGKQQPDNFFAEELTQDSVESEEIPLLSLLDEIFDLKNQDNFWFRKRIIDLFKQIVEATYSNMINQKISEYIDLWTSPVAIAEYIALLKNSCWPNGRLADSAPRNDEEILRRKIAVKALILTSLNDLKKVLGSETLQAGSMSFFELFQHKTLNQRLVLVLFELLLKEIFPDNYFEEIFARLYAAFDSKSNRSTASSSSDPSKVDWPPHLSKFIARI